MPVFYPATGLVYAEPLTSGEAILPRISQVSSVQLFTQVLSLTYWTSSVTQTSGHVETYTTGVAASGATYVNIGVYSVAANGNLTLLASTGDVHASIWSGTYTLYNKALTSGYAQTAGSRYALGVLAVGTGLPTLGGQSVSGFEFIAPIMHAAVTGQATLPSSVTSGIVQDSNGPLMVEAVITP